MWNKERGSKSNEHKQEGQFGNGRAATDQLIAALLCYFFFFPTVPHQAVFQRCAEPVAISVRRRCCGFGMDAITLQEKLVERLLCPRVRTARQKVNRTVAFWRPSGENIGKIFETPRVGVQRLPRAASTEPLLRGGLVSPRLSALFYSRMRFFRTAVLTSGDPRKSL